MKPIRLCIFLGSTRSKRANGAVARWCLQNLAAFRGDGPVSVKPSILDPKHTENGYFMRLMDKAHFHYKPEESPPEELERSAQIVRDADCFLVISPEYNHTIPPGLTNIMSFFGASAYKAKPSGIITYSAGMWGGTRAGVALRPFLGELAHLPRVWTLLQDGELSGVNPVFEKNANSVMTQLIWHAEAMRKHKEDVGTW